MSITVYWACLENEWMRAKNPDPVLKKFYKNQNILSEDKNSLKAINHCPVFNETMSNVYEIKSIYDYNFKINFEKNICESNLYDQDFFNRHVMIRSLENKFFSFLNQYIFFTDEKSLKMTAYQHPIFEDNEITKRCMIIPGTYDIAKWFRPLEFAFILKKEFNEFKVNEQDILYYIQFHTKEQIIFKQFLLTNEINQTIKGTSNVVLNYNKK